MPHPPTAIAVVLDIVALGEPMHSVTTAGFLLIIAGPWLSSEGDARPVEQARPGREADLAIGSRLEELLK